MSNFEKELQDLLNRHSKENETNTPDFILASFLVDCLDAYTSASNRRESWYGKKMEPGK